MSLPRLVDPPGANFRMQKEPYAIFQENLQKELDDYALKTKRQRYNNQRYLEFRSEIWVRTLRPFLRPHRPLDQPCGLECRSHR